MLILLPAGDHIRSVGEIYNHHMIVVKVVNPHKLIVIHYNTEGGSRSEIFKAILAAISNTHYESAEIMEGEFECEGKIIELLQYLPGVALHTGEAAVDRARSRLRERRYSIFRNNCEYFVNWTITEISESDQVERATTIMYWGFFILFAILIIWFIYFYEEQQRRQQRQRRVQ